MGSTVPYKSLAPITRIEMVLIVELLTWLLQVF